MVANLNVQLPSKSRVVGLKLHDLGGLRSTEVVEFSEGAVRGNEMLVELGADGGKVFTEELVIVYELFGAGIRVVYESVVEVLKF